MFGSIAQFFLENWPVMTVTAIVVGFATWFVVHVFQNLKDYKSHKKDATVVKQTVGVLSTRTELIDTRTRHANCHVNTSKIDEASGTLKEVRDIVIAINAHLTGRYSPALNVLAEKQSPLKLTTLGNKILEESNGLEFIFTHKERIFEVLAGRNPQTAYDVQKEAFTALLILSEDPIFNNLKDYIYNAPSIKLDEDRVYTVGLADVCYTMSIPIRDMYLEAHPEIDPSNYSNETK